MQWHSQWIKIWGSSVANRWAHAGLSSSVLATLFNSLSKENVDYFTAWLALRIKSTLHGVAHSLNMIGSLPKHSDCIFKKNFYFFHYSWFTVFCQFSTVQGDPVRHTYIHYFSHIIMLHHKWLDIVLFIYFWLFSATPNAHASSHARGWIEATAAGLHHSHSNSGSELPQWPTSQLMATLDA